MKNIIALSAITAFTAIPTMAEHEPSYDFIQTGFAKNSYDNSNINLDGIKIGGNFEFNEKLYFNGEYQSTGDEYVNYKTKLEQHLKKFTMGIGYKINITPGTSLFAHLNYQDLQFKEKSPYHRVDYNKNGYQLGAGIRSMVTFNTEIYGKLTYADIDYDAIMDLTVGTRILFNRNFGGYIEYLRSDSNNSNDFKYEGYSLGLSYQF